MNIPLTPANPELAALVTRAEAGEEILLTRGGMPVARLTPVLATSAEGPPQAPGPKTYEEKMALLLELQISASAKAHPGPDAAHSQDFLYGDDGLPA